MLTIRIDSDIWILIGSVCLAFHMLADVGVCRLKPEVYTKIESILIALNPWPGCELKASSLEAENTIEAYLRQSVRALMRGREKGRVILSACGQLA